MLTRFRINIVSEEYFKKRVVQAIFYVLFAIMPILIAVDLIKFFEIRKTESEFNIRIERVLLEKKRLEEELGRMGRGMSDDSIKAMRKEIHFVNELLLQKNFLWTSFLSDLEGEVPPHLSVTRIQPDFKTGVVTLGGAAQSLKELTGFVERLQKSKSFDEVFLTNQEGFEKEEGKGISFLIRFKYYPQKRTKIGALS